MQKRNEAENVVFIGNLLVLAILDGNDPSLLRFDAAWGGVLRQVYGGRRIGCGGVCLVMSELTDVTPAAVDEAPRTRTIPPVPKAFV